MIIIVEGIDRVGKTTLCNILSKELDIPIYKHSQKVMQYSAMDNVNETDKMLQLLDICDITDIDIIFDRFHFSDYVYGIRERGYESDNATKLFRLLDEKLYSMNAIIIHVVPVDINWSSAQHGSDLFLYDRLMRVCATLSKTKICTCDYNSIDNTVKKIKEIYNETI